MNQLGLVTLNTLYAFTDYHPLDLHCFRHNVLFGLNVMSKLFEGL